MKLSKNRIIISVLTIIVIILVIVNVSLVLQPTAVNSKLPMKGVITVKVVNPDGSIAKIVKNDTIFVGTYDNIMCALFFDVTACGSASGYNMFSQNLTTLTTTIILPISGGNGPQPPFIMTGIALSSSVVTSSGCAGLLSASGLAATPASTSHTANTNSIVLTASFTYTGASQTIQSVCLLPKSTGAALGRGQAGGVITASAAFAWETFSTVTLTTGQSISISWTFSF